MKEVREIEKRFCSNKNNCVHGNIEQNIDNFYIRDKIKKIYYRQCKDCMSLKKKKNYQKKSKEILEKNKIYRINHEKEIKEKCKKYRNSFALYDNYFIFFENYEEIRRNPENKDLIQFKCKYCGSWMNVSNNDISMRKKFYNHTKFRGEKNFYCSQSCKNACSIFGQHRYPKNFQKNNQTREVQSELRKIVLERDNWTCQKCNKSKSQNIELELHCHHIFPLNENPIESADIDNCITVCKDCHNLIHKFIPDCNYNNLKCSN